jgi:arylsulfatase A-like enzyme
VHHGGTLYLEQIRVPLILWAPSRIPGRREITQPVDLRAIPGTVLDLAGLPRSGFPGRSLLSPPSAADSSPPPAISEGPLVPGNPSTWQTGRGWVKSGLSQGWHLIELQSGERELYDLKSDPGELRNLAGSPEAQDILTRLDQDLARQLTPPSAASGPP